MLTGQWLAEAEAKLAEVRELIGVSADIPLVTADTANEDSLREMVKRASCICTTVGLSVIRL